MNECGDFTIRFIGEDSDTGIYSQWHSFNAGPNWKSASNGACPYDDLASSWRVRRLGGQNSPQSAHIMWFVK